MQNGDDPSGQPAVPVEIAGPENSLERDALIADFIAEIRIVLGSIERMCVSLHVSELDHWNPAQRRVVEIVENAIHDALTTIVATTISNDRRCMSNLARPTTAPEVCTIGGAAASCSRAIMTNEET